MELIETELLINKKNFPKHWLQIASTTNQIILENCFDIGWTDMGWQMNI